MKKVDLVNTQTYIETNMQQLDQKMSGKLEHMEQNIIEALNGRLPKIDKVSKGTQENKGSI
jgi:hypothetical protein